MSAPAIELLGISKYYVRDGARITTINRLTLDVAPGEFVSVVGPKRSGKTTLLSLIAGLELPDEGRVLLNGTDLGMLRDRELAALRLRAIGFLFQDFNLLPALTVERNVAWRLHFAGYARSEVRRRAAEVLDRVDLCNCRTLHPSQLSSEEQQRVAIARAIAARPLVLLADEPIGSLDSRSGQAILDLLHSLNREQGMAVIMVTHSTFAAGYGDRTLELQEGRIVRDVRIPRQSSKIVSLYQRYS